MLRYYRIELFVSMEDNGKALTVEDIQENGISGEVYKCTVQHAEPEESDVVVKQ